MPLIEAFTVIVKQKYARFMFWGLIMCLKKKYIKYIFNQLQKIVISSYYW